MPDATDLQEYGLDKPAATVRFGIGLVAGGAAARQRRQNREPSTRRTLSRPAVFTVESSLARRSEEGRLGVPAEGPVRRQLVQHDAGWKSRTTIRRRCSRRRSRRTRTARKKRSGSQTAPAAKDVDAAKVEALISAATGARATGFVDSTAKTGPRQAGADGGIQV